MSKTDQNVSWFHNLRASRNFTIITVAVAFFVDTFFYGLIIPLLPRLLRKRVAVPDDKAQLWTTTLLATYCLAQLLSAPAVGYLADKWSNRRIPLLAGLVALGVTNGMFAFGRNVALLVVARLLQGISAAIIWAVGLALLVDTVGTKEMATSMSWVTIAFSIGLTSGPLLGGIIYRRAGHYAVFILGLAILIVDLVLRILIIEKKAATPQNGTLSRQASVEGLTTTPDESSPLLRQRATSTSNDRKRPSAFWSLLSSVELIIGLWAILVVNMAQTAIEAAFPLYTAQRFNWTSENSGLCFLALMLPAFSGPIAGALTDRYGARVNTILGLLLIGLAYPCLSFITQDDTWSIVLLCVLLFLVGTGISFVNVAQMSVVAGFADTLEREDPGLFGPAGATAQSCSLINGAFAIAGVAGPTIGGALKEQLGWRAMCITMGVITLVSILPMFRLRK